MDLIRDIVQKKFKPAPVPPLHSGDTVQVHVRITEGEKTRIQIFEGTVIRAKKGGIDATFTVRKISNGIGVERIFPFYSPAIEKVDVVAKGQTRRSRIYYLRGLEGKAARIDTEMEQVAKVLAPVASAGTAASASETPTTK